MIKGKTSVSIQMGTKDWYDVRIEDALINENGREIDEIESLMVYNQTTDVEELVRDQDEIDYILGWMTWKQSDEMGNIYLAEQRHLRRGDRRRFNRRITNGW